MAFTYGGITYHTDEQDPNALRDLITGAGLPGGGTPSYYAPISQALLSQYTTGGSGQGTVGGEGGGASNAPAINWNAMPGTQFGPAYSINPYEPGVDLFNPSLVANDKNYGMITPGANVNNAQWSDYLGPLIGMAIGAGFGALSPAGAGLFSKLPSIANSLSSNQSPTSQLANIVGSTGITSSLSSNLSQLANILGNW